MFRLIFLAFLTLFAASFEPALAQPRRAPNGDVQPLDRFLPGIRSRYPGTFYDADGPYMDETGSPHYRLKWMTPEGRVIWLDTDARTGRVLGVERGAQRGGYRNNAPPPDMAPPRDYYEHGPRNPGGRDFYGRDNGYGHGNWNGGHGNWNGHGNGHGSHGG